MIIIKIILYMTIIAGCSIAGLIKYMNYTERVRILEDYIVQLEKLRIEIDYRNEHVPAICKRLSYYSFFGKVYGYIHRIEAFLYMKPGNVLQKPTMQEQR